MNQAEKFWREIALLLAEESLNGQPKDWSRPRIESFLLRFQEKLNQICLQDPLKAKRCGLSAIRGGIQEPTLPYYSFRRIFITKESKGNRSTREMFAIYLGYDSYEDFLIQKSLEEDQKTEVSSGAIPDKAAYKPTRLLIWLIGLTLVILIAVGLAWGNKEWVGQLNRNNQARETRYLFIRNDDGIALLNLEQDSLIQLVSKTPFINGIEYDSKTRMLYWANAHGGYLCVSRARMNANFSGFEAGTLNTRVTEPMGYPAGIALDIINKRIYYADYGRSEIACFDYDGKLLSASLVGPLEGKPSGIELDQARQILYYTDISNHRIGRIHLQDMRHEPEFITNAGKFPDGPSLDTTRNILYWACPLSNQIGYSPLPNPTPHLIELTESPTALRIDAITGELYYSQRNGDGVRKVRLQGDSLTPSPATAPVLPAGGTSPGGIRIVRIRH